MKDLQRRRAAMNLAAQLPTDTSDRKAIVGYFLQILPFLDGEDMPYSDSLKSGANQNSQEAGRVPLAAE